MQFRYLTKLLFGLFVLRVKPYELPYSKILPVCLAVLFVLMKATSYLWFIYIVNAYDTHNVISLSIFGAILVSVVWVLILFAMIYSTFLYYNILERLIQVVTAFLAMDCLLTLFFLMWLSSLTLVGLPLASGSFASAGIIFSFVLIMYWQFMIYIHLLVSSMNISILKAGVFALFYTILQHNLAELLLNLVIKMN